MITNRELADQAWAELSKTTDSYPAWKRKGFPASSHWAKAKNLLDQVGVETAPPPEPVVPPPSTTPPASSWPASFYTGPLGANNLLPTGPGAFLICQPGGSMVEARAEITNRQNAMGRKYDAIQSHYSGSDTWGGVFGMTDPYNYAPTIEQYAISNGSFPVIAWTPNYTLAQMNTGAADAIWTKAARYWASYKPQTIIVRAFAEFNLGPTYGVFGPGGPYTPSVFRSAWQRMVDVFKTNGASNVGFGYCMDEGNARDYVNSCWPGSAYVDWIMPDTYNRSMQGDGSSSTPLHTGWAKFGELFNYTANGGLPTNPAGKLTWSMYDIFATGRATRSTLVNVAGDLPAELPVRKPMVVGEVGTVYDTAHPSLKGQWFRDIPAAAAGMAALTGVSFYDVDVSAVEGPNSNFLVDYPTSDPSCLAGFVAMAQDPAFKGR